jgi:hypothetical protein
MKKKKVWRYYCDHCGKGGCSAGHMKQHEAGCTKNPTRVCRMCEAAEQEQPPITDLIAAARLDASAEDDGFCKCDNLRAAAHGCPACMLAGARLCGVDCIFDFDYGIEHKRFWGPVNDAKSR